MHLALQVFSTQIIQLIILFKTKNFLRVALDFVESRGKTTIIPFKDFVEKIWINS